MLELARKVLGENIRYDHCVSLNRPGGNRGIGWHSHGYADDDPNLGFVRIFFYVNGFEPDDGGLKAVPGSHLYRDARIHAPTDEALREGWLAGRKHPETGGPLEIEALSAPPGTVALMWTHAAHAVSPRKPRIVIPVGVSFTPIAIPADPPVPVGLPLNLSENRYPVQKD